MPFVVVMHVKGRPGATTAALGLAGSVSSDLRPVVVESDPAGGDLAARFRLPVAPGLVEFAAHSRAGSDFDQLDPYVHRIWVSDWDLEVMVAPPGGAKSRIALPLLFPDEGSLTEPERLVIVDIGRYEPGAPTSGWLSAARVVLLVLPGTVEGVAHAAEWVEQLRRRCGDRLVLLVRGGPYAAPDVASALGTSSTILDFPNDEPVAAALAGDRSPVRRWARRPLHIGLSDLAAEIEPRLSMRALEGVST